MQDCLMKKKKYFIAQLLKECISRKFTQVSFKCMLEQVDIGGLNLYGPPGL